MTMSDNQTCCACTRSSEGWMEDIPMCRYSNPIPLCDGSCKQGQSRACNTQCQLDQVLLALNCQNQLLVDILGAVNGLTAAILADRT